MPHDTAWHTALSKSTWCALSLVDCARICCASVHCLFSSDPMKALAPGTVIFHRHRGYGVITHVNLLTGWISRALRQRGAHARPEPVHRRGAARRRRGDPVPPRAARPHAARAPDGDGARTAPGRLPEAVSVFLAQAVRPALALASVHRPAQLDAAPVARRLVRLGRRLQHQSGHGLGRYARRHAPTN